MLLMLFVDPSVHTHSTLLLARAAAQALALVKSVRLIQFT